MLGGKVRARVLKVEGQVAHLGVFVEGAWERIICRTAVPLAVGDWIVGHLTVPADGSMVLFRLMREGGLDQEPASTPSPTSGLDLEA